MSELPLVADLRQRLEGRLVDIRGRRRDKAAAALSALPTLSALVAAPDALRAVEIDREIRAVLLEIERKPRGRPYRHKLANVNVDDAIAVHGSLRAAARALGVSHTTLARR
jgi:hypothetical protein